MSESLIIAVQNSQQFMAVIIVVTMAVVKPARADHATPPLKNEAEQRQPGCCTCLHLLQVGAVRQECVQCGAPSSYCLVHHQLCRGWAGCKRDWAPKREKQQQHSGVGVTHRCSH